MILPMKKQTENSNPFSGTLNPWVAERFSNTREEGILGVSFHWLFHFATLNIN